jgi:hypothetical protein
VIVGRYAALVRSADPDRDVAWRRMLRAWGIGRA